MMTQLLVVAEQPRRAVDLGQHDIEVTIAVQIGEGRAAADNGFEKVPAAFFRGDRHEASLRIDSASVPEELGGLAILLAGLGFFDVLVEMAVGGQQIEPAVQIVVEKKDAKGERLTAGRADALREGFVGEGERVVLRDVKGGHFIGEVSDGNAQRIVGLKPAGIDAHGAAGAPVVVECDSRSRANFLECAVSFVVKNEVLHRVVGNDQIDPAVAVQIYRGDAERLRQRQTGCFVFNLDTRAG